MNRNINWILQLPNLFLSVSTEMLILLSIFGFSALSYSYSFALLLYVFSLFWELTGLSIIKNYQLKQGTLIAKLLVLAIIIFTTVLIILFVKPTLNEIILLIVSAGLVITKLASHVWRKTPTFLITKIYQNRGLQFLSLFAIGMFALGTNLPEILGTSISVAFLVFVILSFIMIDVLAWKCRLNTITSADCYQKIVRLNGIFVLILFAGGLLSITYADLTKQYPTGNFLEKLENISS